MSAVTDLYRSRLAEAEARVAAALRQLLPGGGDGDVEAALAAAGEAAGPVVAAGQLSFIAEALTFLAALTAEAARVPLAGVAPYAMPAGVAGFAAAGIPVGDLTAMAPRVYLSRLGQGQSPEEALGGARRFIESVGQNEPYRAANATVTGNAVADERLTGRVVRVTGPGACAFCQLIAGRGYLPAHAGFKAHGGCRCTGAPEISSHVYSRAGIARARAALPPPVPAQRPAPAGGLTWPHDHASAARGPRGARGGPAARHRASTPRGRPGPARAAAPGAAAAGP